MTSGGLDGQTLTIPVQALEGIRHTSKNEVEEIQAKTLHVPEEGEGESFHEHLQGI